MGQLSLTPMLSAKGKLIGDFTIACLPNHADGEEFTLTASFGSQAYHMRWFSSIYRKTDRLALRILTRRIGFQIAAQKHETFSPPV